MISAEEYYHIYNRGVDKRTIYEDINDYQRFLHLLYLANSTNPISYKDIKKSPKSVFEHVRTNTLVHIGAYCLMPNHFHILLKPNIDGGASTFMNKLSTAYTMYFNKKNERSGSLFQGTYKAKHASSDEYLKYLFSYIHLNPIKLLNSQYSEVNTRDYEVVNDVKSYQYSSLIDYYNIGREEERILCKDHFPEYFSDTKSLDRELLDWIKISPEG